MSEFFSWDPDKYSIHVPSMDHEHQVLIRCMNTVHELYVAKAKYEDIRKALQDLVAYTQKHFSDEEQYMAQIGYEDRRLHGLVHKKLLEKVNHFAQEFARTQQLSDEFFVFLKTWLKAHICGIDIKYAKSAAA